MRSAWLARTPVGGPPAGVRRQERFVDSLRGRAAATGRDLRAVLANRLFQTPSVFGTGRLTEDLIVAFTGINTAQTVDRFVQESVAIGTVNSRQNSADRDAGGAFQMCRRERGRVGAVRQSRFAVARVGSHLLNRGVPVSYSFVGMPRSCSGDVYLAAAASGCGQDRRQSRASWVNSRVRAAWAAATLVFSDGSAAIS